MDENAGWEKSQKDMRVTDNRSIDEQRGATNLTEVFRQIPIATQSDGSALPAPTASPSSTGYTDEIYQSHFKRDERKPTPAGEYLSFTQLFQSMSVKQASEPQRPQEQTNISRQEYVSNEQHSSAAAYSNREPSYESVHDSASSAPSPGDFTTLFQPVRSRSDVFEGGHSSSSAGNSQSTKQNPIGGGFTQLLRTLSDDEVSAMPFEAPPGATERPALHEPGEFTQIVSRSAVREALLREQQAPVAADTPATAPGRGEKPESNSTGVDNPRVAAFPPLAVPTPPAANLQITQPSMSSSAVSHASRDETSVDRWQKHLPLLLMVNLVVSLLTLVLVAITLLRQH